MSEASDHILTADEAAEILKVSRQTIVRMIEDGEIKATKIRRLWRIKRSDVDAVMTGVGAR